MMQTQQPSPAYDRPPASDLIFLDVSDPLLPRGQDAQRAIRSQVTRQQHRRRREIARGILPGVTQPLLSRNRLNAGHPDRGIPARNEGWEPLSEAAGNSDDTASEEGGLAFLNSDPSQATSAVTRKLVRSHVTKRRHRRRRQRQRMAEEEHGINSSSTPSSDSPPVWPRPTSPADTSEELISNGAAAIRNVILHDSANIFGSCIKSLRFDLRGIVVSTCTCDEMGISMGLQADIA